MRTPVQLRAQVRVAVDADWPAVQRLARQSPYLSSLELMRHRSGARHCLFVVEVQGQVVGFCQGVRLVRAPLFSVYNIGVDAAWRRQGLGRQLLQFAMLQTAAGGIRLKVAVDNDEALEFYWRLGFNKVGKSTNRAGDQLVALEWEPRMS